MCDFPACSDPETHYVSTARKRVEVCEKHYRMSLDLHDSGLSQIVQSGPLGTRRLTAIKDQQWEERTTRCED